jgi:hypothetical protein
MATYTAGNIDNLEILYLISIGVITELILNLNQLIIKGNTVLNYTFKDRRIRELD